MLWFCTIISHASTLRVLLKFKHIIISDNRLVYSLATHIQTFIFLSTHLIRNSTIRKIIFPLWLYLYWKYVQYVPKKLILIQGWPNTDCFKLRWTYFTTSFFNTTVCSNITSFIHTLIWNLNGHILWVQMSLKISVCPST